MGILISLVIPIACCVLCVRLAGNCVILAGKKNQNKILWGILGFLSPYLSSFLVVNFFGFIGVLWHVILSLLFSLIPVFILLIISAVKQNHEKTVKKESFANAEEIQQPVANYGIENSNFDGNVIQYIGIRLLSYLLTVFTLGFGYPWAVCMIIRWVVSHSIIEGRRLKFHGTGLGLFGHWILWVFLSIITLGIYLFWVSIAMEKWKIKNTSFAN